MNGVPDIEVGRTSTDVHGIAFHIDGELGRGGFGEVYLARTLSSGGLEQQVAIKVLRRDLSFDPEAANRIRDEAQLLNFLNHPNVLRVVDLTTIGGRLALVTEYVEGIDLSEIRNRRPALPECATLEVIGHVAAALDSAWREGAVVHRDVKPQNIRIGVYGNVKLLDFGIARSDFVDRRAQTGTMQLVGTWQYVAPERYRSNASNPASDVFALGCVLYETLTRRTFYHGLNQSDLFRISNDQTSFEAHLRHVADNRGLRDDTRALLLSMLSWDLDRRPTANDVARSSRDIARHLPGNQNLREFCRSYAWKRVMPVPEATLTRPPARPHGVVRLSEGSLTAGEAANLPPLVQTPQALVTMLVIAALLMVIGALLLL